MEKSDLRTMIKILEEKLENAKYDKVTLQGQVDGFMPDMQALRDEIEHWKDELSKAKDVIVSMAI